MVIFNILGIHLIDISEVGKGEMLKKGCSYQKKKEGMREYGLKFMQRASYLPDVEQRRRRRKRECMDTSDWVGCWVDE